MIIRTIEELQYTPRDVEGVGFNSIRVLLAKDGLGFSLHKTIIPAGRKLHWHYKHHFEACYCIQGEGYITDLASGKSHKILPDTIYILDKHDDHEFQAFEDVVLISVFNPPIVGNEIHREDGSYASPKETEFFNHMAKRHENL